MLLCASATAQKWTADVPQEPPSTDYQPYRAVDLHFIDADRILVGFDRLGHCDNDSASNTYTAFVFNASNGTIEARREFHGRPESLRLISTNKNGPLLISPQSIQVLDKDSLQTLRTISLPYGKTKEPDAISKLAKLPCYSTPLRVSETPDTSKIEVAVDPTDHSILFVIDASSLQIKTIEWPKRIGEFVAGYEGQFVFLHSSRLGWTGIRKPDGSDGESICDPCGHLDVLSPMDILIEGGSGFSIMREGGGTVWTERISGIREGFGTNSTGNRFVLLLGRGGGLFQSSPSFKPIVFEIEKKMVVGLKSIPIKDNNDSLGNAVAISEDGNRVAIFAQGKLVLYELGSSSKELGSSSKAP